jgi:hypothetical protein
MLSLFLAIFTRAIMILKIYFKGGNENGKINKRANIRNG